MKFAVVSFVTLAALSTGITYADVTPTPSDTSDYLSLNNSDTTANAATAPNPAATDATPAPTSNAAAANGDTAQATNAAEQKNLTQAVNKNTNQTTSNNNQKNSSHDFVYGIGIGAGTLGGSVEGAVSFNKYLSANLGFNYLSLNNLVSYNITDTTTSGTTESTNSGTINGGVRLMSVQLLGNVHPFGGAFRVVGGLIYNANQINLNGTVNGSVSYNGAIIPNDALSGVNGTIKYNPYSPYVGIGWGGSHDAKGFGVTFDMGVMFQGTPKINLDPVYGPDSAAYQSEINGFLNQQVNSIQNDLKITQFYPVLNLQLYYRW